MVKHMCQDFGGETERDVAVPRDADGPAVDPIALLAVDEVTVTTLVDNTFDALLVSDGDVSRPPMGAGLVSSTLFDGDRTVAGLIAEHGFSALVTVRSGTRYSKLLFDTGTSPEGMAVNSERLGIDLSDLQGVVLSHGHFDHAAASVVWPVSGPATAFPSLSTPPSGPAAAWRCPASKRWNYLRCRRVPWHERALR